MKQLTSVIVFSLATGLTLTAGQSNQNQQGGNNGRGGSQAVYLSLGDSVPFGLNPSIPVNLNDFVGFPKIVGFVAGLPVTNAACPFETSASISIANGCPWAAAGDPLYVAYNGASQLDFGLQFLASNKVKLVTVMVGGNDLAQLLRACGGDPMCAQPKLKGVLDAFGRNLGAMFAGIRNTGYKGPIVAVNYYAFNANDPLFAPAFAGLNQVIALVAPGFNVKVADAFRAFAIAAAPFGGDACKAGLLVKLQGGTVGGVCDTHPSLAGQALLAGTVLAAAGDLRGNGNQE